jgi:prepilin-type N-terminal cleavage/methylation domain-containing protein
MSTVAAPGGVTEEEIDMLERYWRKRAAGDGGFTLIELLVVIVIIGILAAIVVFAVGGITDKGQNSACKSDERTVRTAEEAYFAQPSAGNGKYGSMAQLVSAGFLSESSTYHSVSVTGGGTGYTIAAISPCI